MPINKIKNDHFNRIIHWKCGMRNEKALNHLFIFVKRRTAKIIEAK